MSLNINQFAQNAQKGQMTTGINLNVVSARIYASSVATIIPGTALKIVDVAGSQIIVDKAAATDAIFGFAVFDPKKASPAASDVIEVAFDNTVMFMEAGAAIVQGAELEIVATGDKVITAAGTNKIVGMALRKAATSDIIPVLIKTPLFNQVISLASLPAIAFTDLSDTPSDYSGSPAGFVVRVNSGEDGLEFHEMTFLDLADTPADYSGAGSDTVKVNAGATALEFVTV